MTHAEQTQTLVECSQPAGYSCRFQSDIVRGCVAEMFVNSQSLSGHYTAALLHSVLSKLVLSMRRQAKLLIHIYVQQVNRPYIIQRMSNDF